MCNVLTLPPQSILLFVQSMVRVWSDIRNEINLVCTEPTVLVIGGISLCREVLGFLRGRSMGILCQRCVRAGTGGGGIMSKPGNIAASGADGNPPPFG
ncbi:14605_t:CDS:2 [Acaulospora morrowiae]|uniref:14605_t:CDS:1 n=1 Tax=Acaulospora morrowiae TaxID=94023 RepID=A0A9N9A4I6_9GLOM|nr:14605_t:CDS:2 [Acaulospora morrowiae]